jgi:hypothetical protein
VESYQFEATMRAMKRIGLLIDLALLAASLATGGPMADGMRAVALFLSHEGRGIGAVAVALSCALVVFGAAVLATALLNQRKPPFPMVGERDA